MRATHGSPNRGIAIGKINETGNHDMYHLDVGSDLEVDPLSVDCEALNHHEQGFLHETASKGSQGSAMFESPEQQAD